MSARRAARLCTRDLAKKVADLPRSARAGAISPTSGPSSETAIIEVVQIESASPRITDPDSSLSTGAESFSSDLPISAIRECNRADIATLNVDLTTRLATCRDGMRKEMNDTKDDMRKWAVGTVVTAVAAAAGIFVILYLTMFAERTKAIEDDVKLLRDSSITIETKMEGILERLDELTTNSSESADAPQASNSNSNSTE